MVDEVETVYGVDSVYCENKQELIDHPSIIGMLSEKQYVECRISHTTADLEGKPKKIIKTVQGTISVQVFDRTASGIYIFASETSRGGKMKDVNITDNENKMYCDIIKHTDKTNNYTIDCGKDVEI